MLRYKCKDCGESAEILESELGCVKHNFESKHENYEILGFDTEITIKIV